MENKFITTALFTLLCLTSTFSQTVTYSTRLKDIEGEVLNGVHSLEFTLKNKATNKVENWSQKKLILIKDGVVVVELGDRNQGASGVFPVHLISTHNLEIIENGVVLESVSLQPGQRTVKTVKGTDDVQGAKILLSDIDRGTAADGEVLAWNNTEQSWRPRKVGTGGGDAGTSGVNTLNMLKGNVTIDVAPPLTRKQGDKGITIGIDEGAIPKNTGVPVGTIVAYYGNESRVPKGWLLCDGREFKKSDYPELSDLLKDLEQSPTNTPDLRGQFLRGSNFTQAMKDRDSATGDADFKGRSGTGQKIGSLQTDALQGHSHKLRNVNQNTEQITLCFVKANGYGNAWYLIDPTCSQNPSNKSNHDAGLAVGGIRTDPDSGAGTVRTSPETRPKNVAVNWIIKAN